MALVSDLAQFVVSLSIDGRVVSRGSISEALLRDKKLLAEVEKVKAENAAEEQVIDKPSPDSTVEAAPTEENSKKKADGKLIVAEEIAEGHVSWGARASNDHLASHHIIDCSLVGLYFHALGGLIFWVVFLGGFFGAAYVQFVNMQFSSLISVQRAHSPSNVLSWLLGPAIRRCRRSSGSTSV